MSASLASPTSGWRTLGLMNRYHWFVFTVAALGWLADCMDQQLFNLGRVSAVTELLTPHFSDSKALGEAVTKWASYSTSIFLIGWATGGIAFGILGDRWGRARTMVLTILLYSLFTGLSALSVGVYDFAFYRFLTGLGVGGEFAVGVALLAETMPAPARPYTLGLLQAFSALGNVTAALLFMLAGSFESKGYFKDLTFLGWPVTPWRVLFLVGTLPAIIAVIHLHGEARKLLVGPRLVFVFRPSCCDPSASSLLVNEIEDPSSSALTYTGHCSPSCKPRPNGGACRATWLCGRANRVPGNHVEMRDRKVWSSR